MATKQKPIDRLIAKLSSLRKTLRGEERQLLDQIVFSLNSEVAPHAMATKPSTKAANATRPASEVAAHAMNTKPSTKAANATRPASEVAAHSMSTKPIDTAANAAGASATRVELNPKTGVYMIVSN